jgi:Ca2+-binding EF-hand superfamily protein
MLFSAIVEHLGKEEFKDGITYSQFLNSFTVDLTGNQNREQISSMFKIIDDDDSGSIKLEDMKRLVREIGESVTMEELRDLIKNATANNDEITFKEFYNIFKRKLI